MAGAPKPIALAALVLATTGLLVLTKLRSPSPAWTGDEPRYTYYAVSLHERGDLSLPLDDWLRWIDGQQLPRHVHEVVGASFQQSVAHSFLLSPVVGRWGLAGARWAQLAVGMLGFAALAVLLVESGVPRWAAASALVFGFVTLPVQPFLTLFYAEVWLLALVAIAWAGLAAPALSTPRLAATLVVVVAIPFVHLRSAPIAAGLFAWCLLRLRRDELSPRRRSLRAALVLFIATAAAALFVRYELAIAGSLTGTASAPLTPSLDTFVDRLGVQLFASDQGLLPANPAWTLAFAGLALGAVQRRPLAFQALGLLVLAVPAFAWGMASESMPARFWVVAAPALIAGLALWLGALRSPWPVLAAAPLLAVSALVAALLVADPNAFLENRHMSLTYDRLYASSLVPVYLPAVLPWDPVAFLVPHAEQSRPLLHAALGLFALAVAALACAAAARSPARTRAWSLVAAVVIAIPFARAAMAPVPADALERRLLRPPGHPLVLELRFPEPSTLRALRLGDPPGWWPQQVPAAQRAFPLEFAVSVQPAGAPDFELVARVPGRPLVRIDDRRRLAAIRLTELEPSTGTWANFPVTVFR